MYNKYQITKIIWQKLDNEWIINITFAVYIGFYKYFHGDNEITNNV